MLFTKKFLISPSSIALVLLLALSFPYSSEAQSVAQSAMSPKMKKDIAEMYQKMADCMRTEKSIEKCHKDTMTNCPVAKAAGYCPIMDGIKGMQGMQNKGMQNKEAMKTGKMKDMDM